MKIIPFIAGIVTGILALLAFLIYIRSIIKRETVPNKATWFIWTLIAGITLGSYAQSGATFNELWLPTIYLICQLVIFLLSFYYGKSGWGALDTICLSATFLCLLIWWWLKIPTLVLMIILFIDLLGAIPTLNKAYRMPWTEDRKAWLIGSSAALTNLFTISRIEIGLLSYPLYLFFLNWIITVILLLRKKRK